MNHFQVLQYWASIALGIMLCVMVFGKRAHRLVPVFAAYACLMLASAAWLPFIYQRFGFRSAPSYYAYWIVTLLDTILRSLAIAELCRHALRAYRGIWALAWRLLLVLALLLLAHAAWDAWGQPDRLAIYGLTLERDLDMASVAVLVLLLGILKYYSVSLGSLQWGIALGICFSCAVGAINDTVLRNLYAGGLFSWFLTSQKALWPALRPHIERANDLYGAIRSISFVVSAGIWCFTLRKPLFERVESPSLLPAAVYTELSPAINLRLRSLNDRLLEMLKP